MAAWIVKTFGEEQVISHKLSDGTVELITVNPTGYQYVLYATVALYIVALLVSLLLVKAPKEGEIPADAMIGDPNDVH